jgi:hypothetical protein
MNKNMYLYAGIIVLCFGLAFLGVTFFINADKDSCAKLPAEQRDACCENNKPGLFISTFNGTWRFNSTIKKCDYERIKETTPVFCTADVMQCPDGSFVARDPSNGCEFRPCP